MATLEDIGKRLGAYEQPQNDGISRVVQNWGMQLIKEMQNNLLRNKTNASGALSQSLVPQIKTTAKGYNLQILAEDYANDVEAGRKAGEPPPIKNIYDWITNKKSIQIRNISKAKDKVKATQSLAVVIANKIGNVGTKPQPFLNPALSKVTTQVLTERITTYIKDSIEK